MYPQLPRALAKTATAVALVAAAVVVPACSTSGRGTNEASAGGLPAPRMPERHLRNIRQLTFGGQNAESYFSHDGKRLIFQSTRDGRPCDQQYVMNVDGTNVRRVSVGVGKTTCGYFFAGDDRIFFASTHAADTSCPPRPDPPKGYAWRLDPYD